MLQRTPLDADPSIGDLRKTTRWAGDCIVGVEKDYRLARTSQVACFMHGDGDARIIFGDGLERHDERFPTDTFDILVANPPYTIKDFKKHLNRERLPAFDLLSAISEDSDDIEVLFVERASQLLRVGGYAALILPSSILNNAGLYTRARELLIERFFLRAVVEFGGMTFGATGTNTVVLFLERRGARDATDFRYIAEDFVLHGRERHLDWCDSAALLRGYCAHRGVELEQFVAFVGRKPSAEFEESEMVAGYRKWFDSSQERRELEKRKSFKNLDPEEKAARLNVLFFDMVLPIEASKFYAWLLLHEQRVTVVRSGSDTAEQREFLGYTFSDRRGFKGLDMKRGADGQPLTKMYDEENLDNPDKANTHIRRSLLGQPPAPVPAALEKHLRFVELSSCVNFASPNFDLQISLNAGTRAGVSSWRGRSKWPLVRIGDLAQIFSGGTPDTRNGTYWGGGIAWATLKDTKQKYLRSTERTITQAGLDSSNAVLLPVDTVIFSSRATIGDVCIAKIPVATNQGYKNAICDTNRLLPEYLYYVLRHEVPQIELLAAGMTYPEVSTAKFADFCVPLPPLSVQEEIVAAALAWEAQMLPTHEDMAAPRQFRARYMAGLANLFSEHVANEKATPAHRALAAADAVTRTESPQE